MQLTIGISKPNFFQTCIIGYRTCISILSKIGSVDLDQNRAHKFICNICKLHKFTTCNKNFEKSRISDMHYPLTDMYAHFEINRPVRYRNTAKRNYFHRRTDGRTNVAHDNNEKKTTKK